MSVQLTAAGKPPPITTQFELINAWHREMGKMLAFAASLQPEHERIEKMKTWIEAHTTFDANYDQRFAQFTNEQQTYLAKVATLATMSDRVNSVQRRLTEASIVELERELHWPICDHVGQFLALTARATGVSDFTTVLDCFMRDNDTINVNRESVPF